MMILNRDKHIEIIIFVENGINNEIAFQIFFACKVVFAAMLAMTMIRHYICWERVLS